MKFGSSFFGWLTATGMAVLLGAVATAVGAWTGIASDTARDEIADQAGIGLVGGLVLVMDNLNTHTPGSLYQAPSTRPRPAGWPSAWRSTTRPSAAPG